MTQPITSPPLYLNANTNIYRADDLRRYMEGHPTGPGTADRGSFKVLQRQAGAAMSVDIGATGVGLMAAWVRGSTRGAQGLYRVDNVDRANPGTDSYQAQINDTVSTADASNPRIDQVVLEVLDQQAVGGSNLAQIRIVAGTPTGGATLDNRTGAAALPASSLLLADIVVGAAAASIVAANIRDRRTPALRGTIPTLLTDLDAVAFEAAPGLDPSSQLIQTTAGADAQQAAALMYLPRRIVGATRIRWRYQQGATANAQNKVIAIFDASGRLIVQGGTGAYVGSANQVQNASETIAATTFEAGYYYVFIGNAAGTASGSVSALAVGAGTGLAATSPAPNLYVYATSGGTTVPATLLSMVDENGITGAAVVRLGVPMCVLSVG